MDAAVEAVANGASAPSTDAEVKSEVPAPAATEEKPSAPASEPIVDEKKPAVVVKEVAEQTIEEAVKSVDDKIIVVAKPEVNDDNESQAIVQALENTEQSNELSSIEPVSNNTEISAGLGDNSTLNSPPPPLPENPPPSQVSVFAESAMTIDDTLLPAPAHPQPCPIIATNVQTDSVFVGNTKLELISAAQSVVDEVLADAQNDVEAKVEAAEVAAEPAAPEEFSEDVPKPEEIAETIAILDSVNESPAVVSEEIVSALPTEETPVPVSELNDDQATEPIKDDISNDISSPLQQNSLESLPSPQSSDTEVPSEPTPIVEDDLPPPPPPVLEAANDIPAEQIETKIEEALQTDDAPIENAVVDALPVAEINVSVEDAPVPVPENIDVVKTNGQHIEAIPSAEQPTTNGGCKENGGTLKSDKVID